MVACSSSVVMASLASVPGHHPRRGIGPSRRGVLRRASSALHHRGQEQGERPWPGNRLSRPTSSAACCARQALHEARARRAKGEIGAEAAAPHRERAHRRRRWRCRRRSGSRSAPTASSTAATGSMDFLERIDGLAISRRDRGQVPQREGRCRICAAAARGARQAQAHAPALGPGLRRPQAGRRQAWASWRSSRSRRRPSRISAAAARRSTSRRIRTWTDSSPISARVYREEIAALYAAGCRYVQIDETNLPFLCDPRLRDHAQDHRRGPGRAAAPLCRAPERRSCATGRADLAVCMHMCRGNHMSAWVGRGRLRPGRRGGVRRSRDRRLLPRIRLAPRRQLRAAALSQRRQGRGARPRHHQNAALEAKDELKRRIDEAARISAAGAPRPEPAMRLRQHHGRQPRHRRGREGKLRLVVETAREVWGTAS